MATYDIRPLQLRILDILMAVDKVCKEHNLRYYIIAGTLLGAVRHKGFIPWDDDLDIGMPRADYDLLMAHAAEWLPAPFEAVCFENDTTYPLPFAKIQDGSTTLMIVNPEKFIKEVKDLGTMMMNVHYEACVHLHRVVQQIKDAGMKAAVTLNPSTPVAMLADIIRDVDMVLLMSVNPGFGGQKFIVHTLDKVRELRELIAHTGSQALIEVDGGVNLETGKQLVEAGADVLVAGNAVFKAPDMLDMIHRLKSL